MNKQRPVSSPGNSGKRWPRILFGTAVFGILTTFGLFFWSGWSRPTQLAAERAVPTQTIIAEPTLLPPLPTAVPSHTATATTPFTPTAIPTATSHSPTVTATATQEPTSTPSATLDVASETTATPATPLLWPTINPNLLVRPPGELDLSRTHLWFSRPVDGNNNPSAPYRFGMTYNQRLSPHHGVDIDIANDFGTPVLAIGSGTVFYAGKDIETLFGPKPDFYGRLVVIEMADKWEGHTIYTLYGHLEAVNVTAEQPVNPGDVIGMVGSSGVSLGPHLHFEVRQDDPYPYESVRNPELWYWPYTGRGVLAGQVIDSSGIFMPGTRVNLDCSDGTTRYVETYWDQYTVPDDILAENFAISDLPTGTCRVWAELADELVEQFIEIRAGELSGVVLQQVRP